MSYFLHIDSDVSPEQYARWRTKRESEVVEARERLQGALTGLARRKACTHEPHRDLVQAEYSAQEQERLLAQYEYRLWCVNHSLGYSVLMYFYHPQAASL